MGHKRRRGRRVDPDKLRKALVLFQGDSSFTRFAEEVENVRIALRNRGERHSFPSKGSILAFCRGDATDPNTWGPLVKLLRKNMEELELKSSLHDVNDRVTEYLTLAEDGWYKSEHNLSILKRALPQMLDDLETLSRNLDFIDWDRKVLLGKLAGEVAGCLWSFFGKRSLSTTSRFLRIAGSCAVTIETEHPLEAAAIHGIRYYNATGPGSDGWCEPDRVLSAAEVRHTLTNFQAAEFFLRQAGATGDDKYGLLGHKTVEQLIFSAQVLNQGGPSFRKQAVDMIHQAEDRSQGADAIVKAHIKVIMSHLLAREKTRVARQGAIDNLLQAREGYGQHFETGAHYLVAACGMRLRQLGEALRDTLDADLHVLCLSPVRFTDVVDLTRLGTWLKAPQRRP